MALVPRFFVGTSGCASPSARGRLPATSGAAPDLLEAYGRRFHAIEMDSPFYRAPSRRTVRGWAEATSEDFAFTVHVLREATHVDRLGIPGRVRGFFDSIDDLGPRLRCLLFSTPPSFVCDVSRFRGVLDALPEGTRTAWAFRHPSWLCPDVLDLLVERGSAPVAVQNHEGTLGEALLPGGDLADKWDLPFVYVRFRKERYRTGELLAWGKILGDAVARGRDVYAFFRQSPEAAAYATALGELLAEVRPAVPSQASRRLAPAPRGRR